MTLTPEKKEVPKKMTAPEQRKLSKKTALPEGIRAVIFDLDGTLVDSMGMWKKIDIEFLGRFGILLPDGLQEEIEGKSFSETAVYFRERFDLPMTLDELKDCWNEMAMYQYSHEVPLKPGVREFLEYLKGRGIFMGIATSNSRELVTAVTKALDIAGYFSAVAWDARWSGGSRLRMCISMPPGFWGQSRNRVWSLRTSRRGSWPERGRG